MSPTELYCHLEQLADPAYRDFAARLLPQGTTLLGVRLPTLRKLARRIAATPEWAQHLAAPEGCMEEELIRAFLPGYLRNCPISERLEQIGALIPRWNNWSLCDSAACTYTFTHPHRPLVWEWLQPWLADSREYPARFAVVMLLQHFSKEATWLTRLMEALQRVPPNGYYTDMAVAWCASELILRHTDAAACLLHPGTLSPTRLSLTRRKLRESHRSKTPPTPPVH